MAFPTKDKTKIIPGMFMFPLLTREGKEVKYVVALNIWDTSLNMTSDNADTERQGCKRDVEVRDRDETETFGFQFETRPRP